MWEASAMNTKLLLVASALFATTALAENSGNGPDAGREGFRDVYRELVEIDSSQATGSCTTVVRAAERRLAAQWLRRILSTLDSGGS